MPVVLALYVIGCGLPGGDGVIGHGGGDATPLLNVFVSFGQSSYMRGAIDGVLKAGMEHDLFVVAVVRGGGDLGGNVAPVDGRDSWGAAASSAHSEAVCLRARSKIWLSSSPYPVLSRS